MLDAIYKLWPASGFPLAGLVLVVPGNLVMPSVSSARGGGATVWRHQAAAPAVAPAVVEAPGLDAARFGATRRQRPWQRRWWQRPGWAPPGGYSPLNFKLAVKPIGLTLYSSTASWSRAANSASSSSLVPVA